MVVSDLVLSGFRNYASGLVRFHPGLNFFVGPNGQGKTNLAEAIFYLGHLDSFRTHDRRDLLAENAAQATLQAKIQHQNQTLRVDVEVSRKGRRVWLDATPVKQLSGYVSRFFVLAFNPDQLYLFRHFPAERRSFFNRALSFAEPEYLEAIKGYRSVLSHRNQLLKNKQFSSLPEWNRLFVGQAFAMMVKRLELLQTLNQSLSSLFLGLTDKDLELTLELRPSLKGMAESTAQPQETCDAWLEELNRLAPQEQKAGYTLLGPHRDDFRFRMGSRSDSRFSQGEYRAAWLSLQLALNQWFQDRTQFIPVLILDDVFSELDTKVSANLMKHLSELPNQVFVTATHLSEKPPSGAYILDISQGEAKETAM